MFGWPQRGSYVSVEEVGEEHNEEELHCRVDPHISPGHHLCCGERGEEAEDTGEGQGDGQSRGPMVADLDVVRRLISWIW